MAVLSSSFVLGAIFLPMPYLTAGEAQVFGLGSTSLRLLLRDTTWFGSLFLLIVLLCRRGRRTFLHNLHTLSLAKDPLCCLQFFKKLCQGIVSRSEEHTSELQSLMRISYAVFCFEAPAGLGAFFFLLFFFAEEEEDPFSITCTLLAWPRIPSAACSSLSSSVKE